MPRASSKIVNGHRRTRRATTKSNNSQTSAGATQEGNPIYFWKPNEVPYGIFSQWFEEDFKAPNGDGTETKFATAEQYMMYQKAILFNDPTTAAEILATTDPRTQKALGRVVKNFDDDIWLANRSRIVEEGSYWKFKVNPTPLLDTGDRELVEASPRDRIWGIGYGPAKANVINREKWGMNLLGKALMETRRKINEERKAIEGNGNQEDEGVERCVQDA